MVTSQPPSPSPAGRPDRDVRPSIKVGVAASMLRRGHQPLDVANAIDVPLALVELIATEYHPDPPERPEPALPTGATGSMLGQPRSAPEDDAVRSGLAKVNMHTPTVPASAAIYCRISRTVSAPA